jgi:hypothetical protein
MANTTFSGPVRSEAGFQVATKNTTTGAVTTRMSSGMPDLTGLAKADVATGAGFAFAADTITIVHYLQQQQEQYVFTCKQLTQLVELTL